MPPDFKIIAVRFYRTANGVEPVREWLRQLALDDRRTIGQDIARVEYGWPIGMPTCRPLGDGLFKVRTNLPGGRIARVLFCLAEGNMVLLHAFFKTTQKTRDADVALARSRLKEVQR